MKENGNKLSNALKLIRFSKKVVIYCIAFVTVYTIIAIVFQAISGEELSPTLTERVFTCLIGELCITGVLKATEGLISAIKGKIDKDENDNITETTTEITLDSVYQLDLSDEGLGNNEEEC